MKEESTVSLILQLIVTPAFMIHNYMQALHWKYNEKNMYEHNCYSRCLHQTKILFYFFSIMNEVV